MRVAASLEFLQASALVHDDVMDNADTRRGAPAVHTEATRAHHERGWRGEARRFGEGVAIPHGKLPGLETLFGLMARLERPVDFEALDGQPVDIAFLLLAPEGAGADHLKALARVARVLREPGIIDRIRAARDADALYALLTQSPAQAA